MFCEFVVIAFLSTISIPDQFAFLDAQHDAVYYRTFLARNEWLITYHHAQEGREALRRVKQERGIDYVECLELDRHHRPYRDKDDYFSSLP